MDLDVLDLADSCREAFADAHGRPPVVVARAPGRVNLVGEHTDYLGGRCLPVALPYATWVAYAPRDDDRVVLTSQQEPPWQGGLRDDTPGWHRYVLGALRAIGQVGGADVHVSSTVPVGSGLSSSAALICSVLRAVSTLENTALVEPAVRAEVEFVGAPTGGMDQTVSLLGAESRALLLDFTTGARTLVPWQPEEAGMEVLVIDTGVRHGNADGRFARVRREAEEAMAARPPVTDPVLAGRRRHVESENERVLQMVSAAEGGDWSRVGALLTQSHESLRADHRVSCPELDVAVDSALAAGALGARMTGGGFGGACLALVPSAQAAQARARVLDAYRERGWAEPRFLHGTASGPATTCP